MPLEELKEIREELETIRTQGVTNTSDLTAIKDAAEAIQTAQEAIQTAEEAIQAAQELMQPDFAEIKTTLAALLQSFDAFAGLVPTGATALDEVNATPVAAALTPQTIVAGVVDEQHKVQSILMSNVTAAEAAVLKLQDEDSNDLTEPFFVGDPAVAGKGVLRINFARPIVAPSGKGLQVACVGDVGDSTMRVIGYTE